MTTTTLWRFEQDGSGGMHGTATYFPGKTHSITLTLPTFELAHTLYMCIEAELRDAKREGRQALLWQIGRIEP